MTQQTHYVRHRDRMVQESVFEDLRNTLIACRWMTGTTSIPVTDPQDGTESVVTVGPEQILPLAQGHEVNLIDYFPEAEGTQGGTTPPNTLAMDSGVAGEAVPRELGSDDMEQPYTFTMAFYAVSDAVALAVLNDLRDRYQGRLVTGEVIQLYNYNVTPPELVVRMEVDAFRFARDTERVAPHEIHLYFGELTLTDFVG